MQTVWPEDLYIHFFVRAQAKMQAGIVEVNRIEVDWPSGKKQVVNTGLSENQTVQITEPK